MKHSPILHSVPFQKFQGFKRLTVFCALVLMTAMQGTANAQTAKSVEPSSAPAPSMSNQPVRMGSPAAVASNVSNEYWKGPRSTHEWDFSFGSGLGLLSGNAGVPLVLGVSKKVVHEGFVPDINNQVFIEAQTGPLFIKGETVWVWSAHLRWDFEQDELFRYFATAGLSGNFIPQALGDRAEFFPRVGLGMFYSLTRDFKARIDVSHEWTTVGVTLFLP